MHGAPLFSIYNNNKQNIICKGPGDTPFEIGNIGLRTPDGISMNSLEFYSVHGFQNFHKPDTSESFYFNRTRKNKPDLIVPKNVDKRTFSGVNHII